LTSMLPSKNDVKVRLVEQGRHENERSRVCSGSLLGVSEVAETSVERCHSQFV
jgi:hypothetical protein